MADRLIGVDSNDPRLPDVVIDATATDPGAEFDDTDDLSLLTPARAAVRDEKFDVRRAGALVDGTTNDLAALNDATTLVHAAGGGKLLIPGRCLITSGSVDMLAKTGVVIVGPGKQKGVIESSTLTEPIVKVSGSHNGIEDMRLQYTAAASSGGDGIQLDAFTSQSRFRNLTIWRAYRGIALDGVTTPRSEYSNLYENINFLAPVNKALYIAGTSAGGTGSLWNNIYINAWTGSAAGAVGDYVVHFVNHKATFNQLNVEWCDVSAAARDLVIFQQCHGVTINGMHMEGNVLPASRGFINTFNTESSVSIDGLQLYDNDAASGSVGIVRPGAGCTMLLSNVVLDNNTGIAANFYGIFDTSIATGALVMFDGVDDIDGHLDGRSLNYAGTAQYRGWKGEPLSLEGPGTYLEFLSEQASDPAAPAANGARLFTKDNGAGKTQLVVRFATGATQVISTEP